MELIAISKPYPRKGTETSVKLRGKPATAYAISKPYPRKGTETYHVLTCDRADLQFQNHIPARGRKQHWVLLPFFSELAISKSYPRKGTETFSSSAPSVAISYFKTISPQGDGNIASACEPLMLTTISKPYPRKGTETNIPFRSDHFARKFQNHIPARGRKHLSEHLNLYLF